MILKGLIFIKHGQVGTRSEGPEYYIQTRNADFLLKYDESRHLWDPDYRLEFFNRKMVEITGISKGDFVKVNSIHKICAELIPDISMALEDHLWMLESYGKPGSMNNVLEGTKVTANFSPGRVGGSDGCNAYGGDCKIVGNTLSISKIIMTLIACSPPIMKQERQYLDSLKAAETYEIKGKKLYIHCGKEGDLIFVGEGYDTLDKYLAANRHLISK